MTERSAVFHFNLTPKYLLINGIVSCILFVSLAIYAPGILSLFFLFMGIGLLFDSLITKKRNGRRNKSAVKTIVNSETSKGKKLTGYVLLFLILLFTNALTAYSVHTVSRHNNDKYTNTVAKNNYSKGYTDGEASGQSQSSADTGTGYRSYFDAKPEPSVPDASNNNISCTSNTYSNTTYTNCN